MASACCACSGVKPIAGNDVRASLTSSRSAFGPALAGGSALRRGRGTATASAGLMQVALEPGSATLAVAAGGGAIAAALAVLLTDPAKRRAKQAEAAGGDEKDSVRAYFDTQGFDRWRRIYGDADDVNSVQRDIRTGHAATLATALDWLTRDGDGGLRGVTVCDAGCGTGSLTVPLVRAGAAVSASDISAAMVAETARQVRLAVPDPVAEPRFQAQDLEAIAGRYHTVVCLDVLIHYPQEKAAAMIAHLASLAERRLLLSFAPKTPFYAVLKRVGELFPGPSKATRAYLHAEEDVERALAAAGWKVVKREMTATKFYFSRLLEAVPAGSS